MKERKSVALTIQEELKAAENFPSKTNICSGKQVVSVGADTQQRHRSLPTYCLLQSCVTGMCSVQKESCEALEIKEHHEQSGLP